MDIIESLIGETIDRCYRPTSFIGRGVGGLTYKAHETLLGDVTDECALKLLAPDEGISRDETERRIRGYMSLSHHPRSHPRVIRFRGTGIVRGGVADGVRYVAMELGENSLADRFAYPLSMPVYAVHSLALEVCEALAYLHGEGAVHRGMKPSNVISTGDGWKLSDFGLHSGRVSRYTLPGGMHHMLHYVAPEAALGQIDPASDVWALGVMIQEALTQRFPYTAETETELLARIRSSDPRIASGMPAPCEEFVRRCLALPAARRWGAAEALTWLRQTVWKRAEQGTSRPRDGFDRWT